MSENLSVLRDSDEAGSTLGLSSGHVLIVFIKVVYSRILSPQPMLRETADAARDSVATADARVVGSNENERQRQSFWSGVCGYGEVPPPPNMVDTKSFWYKEIS